MSNSLFFLKLSALLNLEFWLNIDYSNEQLVSPTPRKQMHETLQKLYRYLYKAYAFMGFSTRLCTGYGIQITVWASWYLINF